MSRPYAPTVDVTTDKQGENLDYHMLEADDVVLIDRGYNMNPKLPQEGKFLHCRKKMLVFLSL